ncbi:MAG TPA: RimK family alpha-L-glutamate ligase [Gaiellaceae bacterium]|nr:RimK family alpha-L-glutamate ligase [Gaiellaceae bacterium]
MSAIAVVGYAHQTNFELVEAWRALGIDARLIPPADALSELAAGDLALGRLDVLPTLDGVEPGLQVLEWLELNGVTVLNSARTLLAAHDKLLTDAHLTAAGVAHPPAMLAESADDVRLLPFPYVVKPRFGSWGRDVYRCRTTAEREACLAVLGTRSWFRADGAIVQELLPSQGYDLRVIVAGGTVVGAAERVARAGEWRTNISLGGSLRKAWPSPEDFRLAIAAAAAVGGDVLGVDLFQTLHGRTVLEVNGAVEFDRRYSLPDSDVYAAVAEALQVGPGPLAAVEPA